MTTTKPTEVLLDALAALVIELPRRSMNKEQILDLARMARRLALDAELRIETLTSPSAHSFRLADSYDLWPVDDHEGDDDGWMVILCRNGFSYMLSDARGAMVWPTERAAQDYMDTMAPDLPRHRYDPGPRCNCPRQD